MHYHIVINSVSLPGKARAWSADYAHIGLIECVDPGHVPKVIRNTKMQRVISCAKLYCGRRGTFGPRSEGTKYLAALREMKTQLEALARQAAA